MKENFQSLIPAFCNTVYKFQGDSIDEHYNIHDVEKNGQKAIVHCFE